MTTIYHNPRCSKSRATLNLLRARGIEPRIVEYLKTPPTAAELGELISMLTGAPRDLIRAGEAVYKELNLRHRNLSPRQLAATIAAHPQLLQRPIVVHNRRAAIGRPPENVLTIL